MTELPGGVTQTKLALPMLPAGMVARPRLRERLDDVRARVVLVSAPAGFGKTALVLDWLAQRPGSVAWLSVDRGDDDPTRFFNHLAAAVAGLPCPGAERAAAMVRTLGARTGPVPDVLDALAALGRDVVLVLDDVHEVRSPRVLAGLEQLITARGAAPRLVLLTRVDPALPLGRLRVNGELLEIRERDLRFTPAECAALFRELLPEGLDPNLIEQLETRTEGWAAGLRLAALALRDVPDPAGAVATFAGSHRVVVDYLVQEALEKQSEPLQQFLLDTSVLERFTPETCAAVSGDPRAHALLAEVEAANLFLVPLGSDRRWFRYHHLFRELLEFRLRRLQPVHAETLHARASKWFEQAGDLHAAIEHACRLDDRTRLLELLDRHGINVLARSELATLERWLRGLPSSHSYPMIMVQMAWLRVLTERAPDLEPLFAAAEAALARTDDSYGTDRRTHARLHLEVLRCFAARFAGRLEEALMMSRATLAEVAEGDAFIRGLLTFNLARLEMVMGDLAAAADLLERSFDDNLRAGNFYVVLTGLGQAATVRTQREGVYRARQELAAAVTFAEQRHLNGLPAFSSVLYHLAHMEYIGDRLDEAESAATRAVELSRAGNFPEGHANGLLVRARVATARARFAAAERLLTRAAALAHNSNVVLLDTTIVLEQARLALAREQAGAGPPCTPLGPAPNGPWTAYRETETILCLRQALRAQRYEEVEAFAGLLRRESEARGRGVARYVALLAETLLPQQPDRWNLLDQALRFGATRGYVRPLIEHGELLRPVLQAGLGRALSPEARAHARLLLDRIERGALAAAAAPPTSELIEPLTGREEEALRHLFDGLSNKAMARAMFVSGETVKTHLKHLYWKLGASGREEAVARARELGLQPRPPR